MNLEVEETGAVERRLRIEVPTAEVDAAFDAVFREIGRNARLKGFRPGKVPRSVLQRYYAQQAAGEVLERLVRDSLPRAIDESEIAAIGEPHLHPETEPKQGAPFVYEATLEIRPEIELQTVRGLDAKRPVVPEPDQDPIESYLDQLREQHAQLLEEPEGVTAARGLIAVINYEATVDGRPFEGGKAEETTLELDGDSAIPGFEEEIVGMAVGSEREFDLEMPESFPDEQVAGQRAHFRVELVGLKRKELPELDDEFAKDASEFETLEAFRADLERRVNEGREKQQEQMSREAVVDALIEANPFPVPQSLVERQLTSRISQTLQGLQGRVPPEQLQDIISRWREEWRPEAEKQVRLALLVPEIAKAEEIEISDEDVEGRLQKIADERGTPLEEVRASFAREGLIEALRAGLLEQRVVEFVTSEAKLSDA